MNFIKKFKVIGIGELLWDIFPDQKKLGGAPANFAFHINNLGAEGSMISAVGNDSLGNEILKQLESLGLSTNNIYIDETHPTGTVQVTLDSSGKPDYKITDNVAWDFIQPLKLYHDLVNKANAVCFGTLAQRSQISRESIQQLIDSTPDDCIKVFDINLRQHYYTEEIVKSSLDLCNIFKLNEDELKILKKMFSYQGDAKTVLKKLISDFDLKLIALTSGEKGSLLITEKTSSFVVSHDVQIVDTVGAGDSFTAGMVMGFLCDFQLNKIHQIATDLAAYVCTQQGATPAIPDELKANFAV